MRKDRGKTAKICVDGADFKTYDTKPFDKEQYSQKFNGPALRYELATNIQTGDIVHYNGPFKPGKCNDLTIFRNKLKGMLLKAGEKAEADMGYRCELETICHPRIYVSKSDKKAKSIARARHETINRRMKQFGCLHQAYRHNLAKHGTLFRAVVVATQV